MTTTTATTTAASVYQQLRGHLTDLKLADAADALPAVLDQAQAEGWTLTQALEHLLRVEVTATDARRLAGRFRFANLPTGQTLDDFDHDAASGIDRSLLAELGTCRFIDTATNVLLIGPPGVGKTHIATGLGHAAVTAGYRVYFTSAADLAARCHRAAIEGKWSTMMRFFAGPTLLIIDELGYLDVDEEGADLLFQLVSARYEHRSTVITTNVAVGLWADVFGDAVTAAAIADRVCHHCTMLKITGRSYRMKDLLAEAADGDGLPERGQS